MNVCLIIQVAEEAMIEADGVVAGIDLQLMLTLEDFEHECHDIFEAVTGLVALVLGLVGRMVPECVGEWLCCDRSAAISTLVQTLLISVFESREELLRSCVRSCLFHFRPPLQERLKVCGSVIKWRTLSVTEDSVGEVCSPWMFHSDLSQCSSHF